jgi:hypothetical protein
MRALAYGNSVREDRRALKDELREGRMTFADALEDDRARDIVVWKLLAHLPRWGTFKINELSLRLIREGVVIGYGTRIRRLTVRQRLAIIAAVESPRCSPQPAPRRAAKPKPAPRAPRPELVAAREAAQVAVENPPPRCTLCKAQLLAESVSGLCRFCEIETAEAA